MVKRILSIVTPVRSVIVSLITIFGFFGITADNIMNYEWIIEAAKWSLWVGLFILAAYACHYYKAQYEERLAIFNIEKNKDTIRNYLFGQKGMGICPRCNNNSFDVAGISKIDNLFVAQKRRVIPLLILGCNSCGHIEIMNYTIVDNNLTIG